MRAVVLLNIWGLMLIGLALMPGCLSPRQCLRHRAAGALLSGTPTLDPDDYRIPEEGHYLLVNKNVVELAVLAIFVALPSGTLWGLDRLLRRWRAERATIPEAELLVEKAPDASPISISGILDCWRSRCVSYACCFSYLVSFPPRWPRN